MAQDPMSAPPAAAAARPAGSPAALAAPPTSAEPKPKSETRDTLSFLVKLVIIVVLFRSLIFSPFSIPSESMVPQLLIGDYLFISKWNYGYSRYSLPFSPNLFSGRIFEHLPDRGDVVVFKAPPFQRQDYIKRVIGLPGDTVQMVHGQVILNGQPVPKVRIADYVLPLTPNYGRDQCSPVLVRVENGQEVCRVPQFRETLPDGRQYTVLDRGEFPDRDEYPLHVVPAGHVFLMGDNRDDSGDSRFEAQDNGPIGMVPIENLEGRAVVTFWSTDGSAEWLLPWTWFTAARWSRIGRGF